MQKKVASIISARLLGATPILGDIIGAQGSRLASQPVKASLADAQELCQGFSPTGLFPPTHAWSKRQIRKAFNAFSSQRRRGRKEGPQAKKRKRDFNRRWTQITADEKRKKKKQSNHGFHGEKCEKEMGTTD
jgi:hypothetical protein